MALKAFTLEDVYRRNAEFFPGGNKWSLDQDLSTGIDCYVHLC